MAKLLVFFMVATMTLCVVNAGPTTPKVYKPWFWVGPSRRGECRGPEGLCESDDHCCGPMVCRRLAPPNSRYTACTFPPPEGPTEFPWVWAPWARAIPRNS